MQVFGQHQKRLCLGQTKKPVGYRGHYGRTACFGTERYVIFKGSDPLGGTDGCIGKRGVFGLLMCPVIHANDRRKRLSLGSGLALQQDCVAFAQMVGKFRNDPRFAHPRLTLDQDCRAVTLACKRPSRLQLGNLIHTADQRA